MNVLNVVDKPKMKAEPLLGRGSVLGRWHHLHFMRTLHITTGAALLAALVVGCSKSSNQPPHVTAPQTAVEAMQQQYQEQSNQIHEVEAKLKALSQTYKTNDQTYLDEQHKLSQLRDAHRILYAKIATAQLDAQIKAQSTN